MKWNDEVLGGKGFVNWYEFDHPQLGKVELGGWDSMFAWANPPAAFLEKEISRFPDWIIWHALISPKLELRGTEVKPIGKDAYRVRLVVENTGWLPTYVTKKAVEKKVSRGVICEIELPEGATLQSGKVRDEFNELEGRAYKSALADGGEGDTDDRLKVEWIVQGAAKLSSLGFAGSPANTSLFLALLLALAVHVFVTRTRRGFEWRAVGQNARGAENAGVRVPGVILGAMCASGALAGAAGVNYVLGYKHYFEQDFTAGAGFMGIAVALIGRNHPVGVLVAALFFGALAYGGLVVNQFVPADIVNVLRALVILFAISAHALTVHALGPAEGGMRRAC